MKKAMRVTVAMAAVSMMSFGVAACGGKSDTAAAPGASETAGTASPTSTVANLDELGADQVEAALKGIKIDGKPVNVAAGHAQVTEKIKNQEAKILDSSDFKVEPDGCLLVALTGTGQPVAEDLDFAVTGAVAGDGGTRTEVTITRHTSPSAVKGLQDPQLLKGKCNDIKLSKGARSFEFHDKLKQVEVAGTQFALSQVASKDGETTSISTLTVGSGKTIVQVSTDGGSNEEKLIKIANDVVTALQK